MSKMSSRQTFYILIWCNRCVKVDREARRLAGYRYGRQIADDFLTQLGQGEEQVARWLEAENDPRLNEIVSHLNHVVEEARIR